MVYFGKYTLALAVHLPLGLVGAMLPYCWGPRQLEQQLHGWTFGMGALAILLTYLGVGTAFGLFLWTSVCIVGPALSALDQGFEVYVITDASGDISTEAHERAVERMIQAGARPITSLQYLLELQRGKISRRQKEIFKRYGKVVYGSIEIE